MAYDQQQARIDRQNLIAQALRDSGNVSDSRVNRSAGGFVTPISKFETITKLLEQGGGAYAGYQAGQSQDELNAQKDADKQKAISGLMDSLAGASQMGQAPGATPQPDPTQPPVGATTNFDPSAPGAGTAQPQQPTLPPTDASAAPVEQNQKRAAMAALLQGQPSDQIIQSLQGAALKRFEPKPDFTLGEDQRRISGDTGATLAQGAPKVYKPPAEDRALVDIVDQKAPGGYRSVERQNFKEGTDQLYHKPSVGDAAAAGLTGDALDMAADRYRKLGELGVGRSPAVQIKIMNRAAEQAIADGDTAAAATIRQKAGQAASSALKKFEGTAQALNSFEKVATKSSNLALQLSDKVDRPTNQPIFTAWLNNVGKKFDDKTDLGNFDNQITTYVSEYGKIMSGSMGNSQLSDSAAQHARDMLSSATSAEDFKSKMGVLGQDIKNRQAGQIEERADLYRSLGSNDQIPGNTNTVPVVPTSGRLPDAAPTPAAPKAAPPADAPPPAALSQLKEGFETTFGNGQVWTLKNGQPTKVRG